MRSSRKEITCASPATLRLLAVSGANVLLVDDLDRPTTVCTGRARRGVARARTCVGWQVARPPWRGRRFRPAGARRRRQPEGSHEPRRHALGWRSRFDGAVRLTEGMPFESAVLVWKTLLASCRLHGNLETGRPTTEKLTELEEWDSASYVLMSGTRCAPSGETLSRARRRMDDADCRSGMRCTLQHHQNRLQNHSNQYYGVIHKVWENLGV